MTYSVSHGHIPKEYSKMPLSIKSRILTDQLGGDSYFHPKTTLLPNNTIAMSLQTIGGSDYFGPVQTTYSKDNGESWEKPQNNPAFEWAQY